MAQPTSEPESLVKTMKNDTKQKILNHGAVLVYKQGFNNTGVGQILKAAGVPKGSFYHYFSSKEDFGLELLDYLAGWVQAIGAEAFKDKHLPPLERLRQSFLLYLDGFERSGFRGGCPIGNLCLEMSDLSPAFREKLAVILERMRKAAAGLLEEAREAGDISPDLDIDSTANFLISGWQGALLQTKVVKTREPLEIFLGMAEKILVQ